MEGKLTLSRCAYQACMHTMAFLTHVTFGSRHTPLDTRGAVHRKRICRSFHVRSIPARRGRLLRSGRGVCKQSKPEILPT